jgi:hypothetical protein
MLWRVLFRLVHPMKFARWICDRYAPMDDEVLAGADVAPDHEINLMLPRLHDLQN